MLSSPRGRSLSGNIAQNTTYMQGAATSRRNAVPAQLFVVGMAVCGAECCKFSTTGKSLHFASSPKIKNISLYRNSDLRYQSRRPAPTEGRFAIVTIRRAQDAMAAVASGDLHRTRRPQRTAKSCGPGAATLALRRREVSRRQRGARKAASPGRARISRKTIARGKSGCLGCTCQNRVQSFAFFRTRRCGRSQRPAFPAPSSRRGPTRCTTRAKIGPRE
jgi:hypothetical protein